MSRCSRSKVNCSEISTCRNKEAESNPSADRGFSCSRACRKYGQSLGQSSVTSRCSPQHCGQIFPCTAGQNRFSFRSSQIAQLKVQFLEFDYFTARFSTETPRNKSSLRRSASRHQVLSCRCSRI